MSRAVFSIVLTVGLWVACGGLSIRQTPLTVGAIPPLERPGITWIAGDVAVASSDAVELDRRMILVSSGFVGDMDDRYGLDNGPTSFRLEFMAADESRHGRAERISVALDIPEKGIPHLERKAVYQVRYRQRLRVGKGGMSQAISFRGEDTGSFYLLAIDLDEETDWWPPGLALHRQAEPLYRTTVVTPDGCTVDKRHFSVRMGEETRGAGLVPGEERRLRLEDGEYRVFLLDCSSATTTTECVDVAPGHFSYVVERTDADI